MAKNTTILISGMTKARKQGLRRLSFRLLGESNVSGLIQILSENWQLLETDPNIGPLIRLSRNPITIGPNNEVAIRVRDDE